ncbi:MAG: hypothetical protein V1837_04965 [Candidatus Woesearchaeota archaeon]
MEVTTRNQELTLKVFLLLIAALEATGWGLFLAMKWSIELWLK